MTIKEFLKPTIGKILQFHTSALTSFAKAVKPAVAGGPAVAADAVPDAEKPAEKGAAGEKPQEESQNVSQSRERLSQHFDEAQDTCVNILNKAGISMEGNIIDRFLLADAFAKLSPNKPDKSHITAAEFFYDSSRSIRTETDLTKLQELEKKAEYYNKILLAYLDNPQK